MMHPFAINSDDRRRVPLYIALCAFLVAWVLSHLIELNAIRLPFWVEVPSVFGLYEVGYELFRRRLWADDRWRFFSGSRVPRLSGIWEGTVRSSFDEHAAEHDVKVDIVQNWTDISIQLDSTSSHSYSLGASITTDETGSIVSYEFLNEPKPDAVSTMHAHRGTARLRLSADETRLEGEYYSGRDRGNQGVLFLNRIFTTP